MGYWDDSNINFIISLPIKMLTKGFLVKIVPEVPFISKQLSTSPPSVKKKREKQNHFIVFIRFVFRLYVQWEKQQKCSKVVLAINAGALVT